MSYSNMITMEIDKHILFINAELKYIEFCFVL